MSGHTPGPWFVRHCDGEYFMCMTVVSTKDYGLSNDSQFNGEQDTIAITYHQCVPLVSGGFEIDDCDERDANARLIAAAPELLEALRRCKFDSLNMSLADLEFCRSAYAKATGEQS